MLGVAVHGFVLAEYPVDDAGGLLVIDFAFLAEVDAADPLVLYLLEGRLYLEDGGQFVEQVPQGLVFAVHVVVLGGLADEPQQLDVAVRLLELQPLLAFSVDLVLLLLGFGIGPFGRHKYNLFKCFRNSMIRI